jgi:hypothetical protein
MRADLLVRTLAGKRLPQYEIRIPILFCQEPLLERKDIDLIQVNKAFLADRRGYFAPTRKAA